MVTLISQDLSEFALHVRAFLGLPVGGVRQYGPAASAVILPQLTSQNVTFDNVDGAVGAGLQVRLFGKPEIDGTRRLGVALATGDNVDDAVASESGRCERQGSRIKNGPEGPFFIWRMAYCFAPSTASRASLVMRSQSPASSASAGTSHEPPMHSTLFSAR